MNDYVLHALTDRGIETYTLRSGHKVFSSHFEYNLRDDYLYSIEACPRLEDPICLIGLRPFLGVQMMLLNNEQLVLLATSAASAASAMSDNECISSKKDVNGDINWTIYNLKLPSPEDLFYDFEELAKVHMCDCPSIYSHLMNEAHMIMRVAKEFYHIEHSTDDVEEKAHLQLYKSTDCDLVFLESCRKLADFSVMSDSREEYCQAFPYYTMGKVSVTEVFDRAMALKAQWKRGGSVSRKMIGLVHTLKIMFIKMRHGSEEMGRLLTSVRNYDLRHITFGEELLELFLDEAPDEIASLALRSQFFREFMCGKVCEVIKSKKKTM